MSEFKFKIGEQLAYMGKKDCTSPRCRRMFRPGEPPGPCLGWHCARCDKPCGPQGHKCEPVSSERP
jgi:hypothetical protein